jgi:uncharacterized protein (DUF433 family)
MDIFFMQTLQQFAQRPVGFEDHARISEMKTMNRITLDPNVMGGKPCIRGLRVTVGMIVGLVAAGHAWDEILRLYPYLEREDISAALTYASWRADEYEVVFEPSAS